MTSSPNIELNFFKAKDLTLEAHEHKGTKWLELKTSNMCIVLFFDTLEEFAKAIISCRTLEAPKGFESWNTPNTPLDAAHEKSILAADRPIKEDSSE